MRPSFHPRLVNGPFDDPVLFIPFIFENRAIVFDLGELTNLSPRDILKISHIFVTHTHMDHFAGFDKVLRLFLGRDKTLFIYGPKGFIKNIEGKLSSYSWNLVQSYSNAFIIHAVEVDADVMTIKSYRCQDQFLPGSEPLSQPFSGMIHTEPSLIIYAVILDHSIPCLGFTLKEQFHINILKDVVLEMGLEIGPWIRSFKQAIFNNQDPQSMFEIVSKTPEGTMTKQFVLGELMDRIAKVTPGQKITYIVDVGYNESNLSIITDFAKDADQLFIEAAFLEQEREIAQKKRHLTAWQAGMIAAKARVKQFTIFHFSPRYIGKEHLLYGEASEAYQKYLTA